MHVGKDFAKLGNTVCRVTLIFLHHETLQDVSPLEWGRRSQNNFVPSTDSTKVLSFPQSVKSSVMSHTALSACMCMTSVLIVLASGDCVAVMEVNKCEVEINADYSTTVNLSL